MFDVSVRLCYLLALHSGRTMVAAVPVEGAVVEVPDGLSTRFSTCDLLVCFKAGIGYHKNGACRKALNLGFVETVAEESILILCSGVEIAQISDKLVAAEFDRGGLPVAFAGLAESEAVVLTAGKHCS